jgi:hypothetical protein
VKETSRIQTKCLNSGDRVMLIENPELRLFLVLKFSCVLILVALVVPGPGL